MLSELFDIIRAFFKRVIKSRLFPVTLAFILLFSSLVIRLFDLQIMNAEYYQETYKQKTLATIVTPSTRGNIYDSNGKLVAYNELTYDVIINDIGAYETNGEKNSMILSLVQLLMRMDTEMDMEIPLTVEEDQYVYTTRSNAAKRRFMRDLLGTKLIEQYQAKDNDPYEWTEEQLMDYLKNKYYFHRWKDTEDNLVEESLSKEEVLYVLNVRYGLTLTSYRKYVATVVASDVDESTVAAVKENSANMKGVDIRENNERVYPYKEYLAAILGYTGAADEEELEALKESDPGYALGDTVGKAGIEEIMELELQGTKGSQKVYKDSTGHILEVIETTPQISGDDVYLTIDAEKTVGITKLMEQMIAGILIEHMVNHDVEKIEQKDPDIPVKDAYINLIANNVLNLDAFGRENASQPERLMYEAFTLEYDTVVGVILGQMVDDAAPVYSSLSKEMQDYYDYIYSDLLITELGILEEDKINRQDEVFLSWKEGTIHFREFLKHAISEDWMNTEKLELDSKYSSTEEIFNQLVNYLSEHLPDDVGFAKLIYKSLINNNVIPGNWPCAALYYQGVLEYDQVRIDQLMAGNRNTAFDFMIEKIRNLEITPAQLALDPCSGAVVVTDVATGKVLSMVSYPSYDNNEFSGRVDADYYNSLLDDASLPLYNRATYSTMAPGSTFKMVTAAAGLEEGVISQYTQIPCVKVYEKVTPNPSCWVALPGHADQNIFLALANSCNYYFYDIGYRLCQMPDGGLNLTTGLNTLREYAALFGFGEKSGIEIGEAAPRISDVEPIATSIGQGTNAYSTVHLARYATTLASRGNVYSLSLLDEVVTVDNKVTTIEPEIIRTAELQDSTWNAIWKGMYDVVHSGTISPHFANCSIEVAAKTGTAQEDLTRSEHAQFVSFAPYDAPEITVSITIPNGYTSGNNAYLANDIYEYWYDYLTMDEILARKAFSGSGIAVDD